MLGQPTLILLMLVNRNNKPSSLTKRKIQVSDLSSIVLKCNGIMSALSFKNNRVPTQALSNLKPLDRAQRSQLNKHQDEDDQDLSEEAIRVLKKEEELCIEKEKLLQQEIQEQIELTRKKKKPYRSRTDKRSSISRQKLDKSKVMNNSRLIIYFRNQIISLFSTVGKRQEFIHSLKGNKLSSIFAGLKVAEIEQRLQKQLMAKGKDKPRKNFHHLTNQQLRSIKYKSKPLIPPKKDGKNKQGCDQETQQQKQIEEQDDNEDCPDMLTWKKRNGVGFNQKVFIIKGGYRQLRQTLLSKGWAENEDVKSKFFDMKWTTKICDIDYAELKNGQIVNHFNNNHHLTSKYGITRRLRSLPIVYNIDIDRFYPRCFDMGDQNEFENFVQNFKFAFVQGEAKGFLIARQKFRENQLKVRTILKILKKMNLSLAQKINLINNCDFPVIMPGDWAILTETQELAKDKRLQKLAQLRAQDLQPNSQILQKTEVQYFNQLHFQIQKELQKLKQNDPQSDLNGIKNVWIAKPNFLSRGRGIRCFNNLFEIADYCLGRDVQFVIQKYIQRPLLVQGRKFDIRQWVLIQDYCPPKIYFYNQCYFRFCMDDFSLDNIHNRFIHLTNNSVQKHNKKCKIDESMWQMSQFAKHVGEQNWNSIQQKMKNIVVWSIKSCENYVTSKKGSFQLVGFDFMIDENLNPWLIEINMSPSMDSSTPVTKKLVKMLLHDTALLISSSKPKKNVGSYTCIFEEDSDLSKYSEYLNKQ